MSRKVDSLTEEIETLKRKIHLLDGDKTAHYENTQWEMEQNRHHIQQLRQENDHLRKNLSKKMAADDDVITDVFKSYSLKPPAELRGIPGKIAVQRFDQTVCELIKRRNTLQHEARSRQVTLEQLTRQLAHMDEEAAILKSTPEGVSEEAKTLRELENRLDRAIIQCNEANHVCKIYQRILEKMKEEKLHYNNEIDDLESAIRVRLRDLGGLKVMKEQADKAREIAREQLSQHEMTIADSKKEREKVLSHYRELAAEKKEFADKVDRRVTRKISIIPDDSLGQLSESEEDTSIQEQQEQKISSYEEAFAKIKDATGVSDIQEVVARFLNQGETRTHLEQLREEHTQQLERLREEKDKLQAQFEEMKYSGEAKMSSGQRMLEEFQSHLHEAHNKEVETKDKADRACRLLAQIKSGVDHLAEKLKNVKPPHTHMLKPKLDPSSDEYVLDQLSDCEHKLVGLVEELSSRELETIHKEMEDEEFRHTVEGGVPGNVRIVLTKGGSQPGLYDDESGSDDEGVMRDAMKRDAQQLMELKTKKKPQDDDDEDDSKKRKRRR